MKVIKFLCLLCLALNTINTLGMEGELKKATTFDSPVTSAEIIHPHSAVTSPAMAKQNSRPMEILTHAKDEYDDLSDISSESSDDISWKELRKQMAQNYKELQNTFVKVQDLKKRSGPANTVKKPKKVRFKDDTESSASESSSSSNDSDVNHLLESL